jgi:hypothetical protein
MNLMVMYAGYANRLRVAWNRLRSDDTSRRVNRGILETPSTGTFTFTI